MEVLFPRVQPTGLISMTSSSLALLSVRVHASASSRQGLAVVSLLNPNGNVLYSSLHSGQKYGPVGELLHNSCIQQ